MLRAIVGGSIVFSLLCLSKEALTRRVRAHGTLEASQSEDVAGLAFPTNARPDAAS